MKRLLLAALLIALSVSAPRAQLSMMGIGPANNGPAAAQSCTTGSNMNGTFDLTNTCNDIYLLTAVIK